MTPGQIIDSPMYVIGALILSVMGVLAFGAVMEAETRFRRLMIPVLYPLILIANGAAIILSSRNVSMAGVDYSLVAGDSLNPFAPSRWLVRLAVITVIAVCVARVIAAAISMENRGKGGTSIFVAFGFFFLTNTVLSSAFGTQPKFIHDLYYPPFLFAAVFATRTQDPEISIRFLKWGLLIFLAASCMAAVVAPDLVIQRMYNGWLPGVTIRLWGLSSNPNSIGPLALVFLLLAIHQPFAQRWLHYLGLLIAVVVLLLAESKTVWAAAAITLPLLLVLRYYFRLSSGNTREARASFVMGLAGTSMLALGVVWAFTLVVLPQFGVYIDQILAAQKGAQLLTLSGRGNIWIVAFEEWTRNPLFGYGVTMWDEEFRRHIGLSYAYSAHNQFLESLGAAGLFGLIGLLVYLGTLLRYSIAAQRTTCGLSIVLFIFVLLRCLTETPLSIHTFLGGEFVTHLLLFHIALVHGCRVVSAGLSPGSILSLRRSS